MSAAARASRRWADRAAAAQDRAENTFVTWRGWTRSLGDWAQRLGETIDVIAYRARRLIPLNVTRSQARAAEAAARLRGVDAYPTTERPALIVRPRRDLSRGGGAQ